MANTETRDNIRFSVIIPMYNSQSTIASCMLSVLRSMRKDVELLLVDNDSTDATLQVVHEVTAQQDWPTKITYLYEELPGVSSARNTGIDAAVGEYLIFLDSDDELSADYFEVNDRFDGDELVIWEMQIGDQRFGKGMRHALHGHSFEEQLGMLLHAGLLLSSNNKRFRKALVDELNLRFDEAQYIGEDFMFSMRYCIHCKNIQWVDQPLYYVNTGNLHSLSRGYRPHLTEQLVRMYYEQEAMINDAPISDPMKRMLLREMDYHHAKAVCTCIGERFKVQWRPYLLCRREMQAIVRAFDTPIAGADGTCNRVHRILNFMLSHHWIYPIYVVTALKKARPYAIYRQMRRPSGIVLAFDDGRRDNYHAWREVLEPLGIPVTINITTAYNDRSGSDECNPTSIAPLGPERIAELAASPLVEIGCHGKKHICEPTDAREGEQILKSWIGAGEEVRLGYACPNSAQSVEALRGEAWKHFRYLRTGLRFLDHEWLRTMVRKVNHFLHIPTFYAASFAGCIMKDCPDRILYAASVFHDTSVKEILSLVNLAVKQKGHLILLFHSVGDIPGKEGYLSYDEKKFRMLCEQLIQLQAEHKIQLMTTAELYGLLGEERDYG